MAKKEEVVEEQKIELQLNDLFSAVNIIDTLAKRGLVEGAEMEAVGGVRNRIEAFAKANLPKGEVDATEQ